MIKVSYLYLAITIAFLFSGCATLKAKHCSEAGGYEQGMNDAKTGKLMSMIQFSTICDDEGAAQAQKGYRAGYEAGSNHGSSSQMNLTFQNGKMVLVGAYECTAHYHSDDYTQEASTEAEARKHAFADCRKDHPNCDESKVTCKKN